jgi:hypothetical protein
VVDCPVIPGVPLEDERAPVRPAKPAPDQVRSRHDAVVVEEDDRGDIFYSRGHIDARLFIRAVVAYMVGYEAVGDVIDAIRRGGGRSRVIGRVRHVWRSPGDGWRWCSAEDPGAEAWTMVEL